MSQACKEYSEDFLLGYQGVVELERDSSNGKRIFYDIVKFDCDKKYIGSNEKNYCKLETKSYSIKSRTKERTEHDVRYSNPDIKNFLDWLYSGNHDKINFIEKNKK